MVIGDRLRELREARKFSQGEIEKRTGLLRCYISRVENGHTVPSVDTLEKLARALEVPMYQLFHAGDLPANVRKIKVDDDEGFGLSGRERTYFLALHKAVSEMTAKDRNLLLHVTKRVAKRN
ncbi:MAG: helix-turn-helix transcriptional regulator [Acidobacteria bacterium]|nr:helix-turn-helix transcriptional regulator [Acidobacteriota bacterium]